MCLSENVASRRVCHVPCSVLCLFTVPSQSVWAVRSLSSSLEEVLSSFAPPEPSLKQNVGFHITWEEWEGPSGFDSATLLWGVRDLCSNARAPNVRTADPTTTTHLRSENFVCHSRSDMGKVDRNHHNAHTPHLALPRVRLLPFITLEVPLPYRFRMNANFTIICLCVLSRKPR